MEKDGKEKICPATDRTLTGRRVLLLFPHMMLTGGALQYTLKLADALVKAGAVVAILTLQMRKNVWDIPNGVGTINLAGPSTASLSYWLLFPLWQKKINQAITAWWPDVIVPQVFPSNWWGWLYKGKYPDTKLVWVCHEPSAFIHSPEWINGLTPVWKKWLAKCLQPCLRPIDIHLAQRSDFVITNSQYTATQCKRIYCRASDAIAYPGVDHSFLPSGDQPREKALITAANLTPYKRIGFLLRVFALLKEHHPGLVYHIAGDGEDAKALQMLARELGIGDSVIFHGRLTHSELAALTCKMTLFLHGSVNETFGMAPLEAIACGTPVVAHYSGGPLEFVNPTCGRLIDSLSEEKWCEEISDFLSKLEVNPDYFMGVSENAREFTWESTLAPALKLIADLDHDC
jgi:glycosyltransferase involved in cell wall biosynthesis